MFGWGHVKVQSQNANRFTLLYLHWHDMWGILALWAPESSLVRPSLTSFHPSIPLPFFFLIQISPSMPCTCLSGIWTMAVDFKQLSKSTKFFPFLFRSVVSFFFWEEHGKYTWSEGRETGIMICRWGFVIRVDIRCKAEQTRGEMKRWHLTPLPPLA